MSATKPSTSTCPKPFELGPQHEMRGRETNGSALPGQTASSTHSGRWSEIAQRV